MLADLLLSVGGRNCNPWYNYRRSFYCNYLSISGGVCVDKPG